MKISTSEVKKIAALAGLKLTPAEVRKFGLQLSAVLDYVQALKKVNTENVKETASLTGLTNVWRADRENKKRYLKKGDYFRVNRII